MYGGSGAMLLPGQSVRVRCRGAVPACLTAAFLTGPGGGRSGFWPLGGAQSTAFLWLWFPGGGHGLRWRPGRLWSLFPPGLQPWAQRCLETLGT